jgi:Do/DeqQ family serine protease
LSDKNIDVNLVFTILNLFLSDMKKSILIIVSAVVLSSLSSIFVTKKYLSGARPGTTDTIRIKTSYNNVKIDNSKYPDFTYAAEHAVKGVVYVQVRKRQSAPRELSFLEMFFGDGSSAPYTRETINAGSGVIISNDGYIVTNNHVVDGGVDILVTLNDNKKYEAKLVGADPVTDVALLKIDAVNLTSVPLGNSDSLRLGEWVLAIGSPFNLKSTITAGIVSAKGRSLDDGSRQYKIESFIQTDAAVNPGNSGGALVNRKGELVGINTAIASNTGSYTGYSFAVPVSMVKHVVSDILSYGTVQRAVLGISMAKNTPELASYLGFRGNRDVDGICIVDVKSGSAADKAGLKKGDIIYGINGKDMYNPRDVQKEIGSCKPGDVIKISLVRSGSKEHVIVKL